MRIVKLTRKGDLFQRFSVEANILLTAKILGVFFELAGFKLRATGGNVDFRHVRTYQRGREEVRA